MTNLRSEHTVGHDGAGCDGAVLDRSTTCAATAASRRTQPVLTTRAIVRGLAWDVGLPLVVFYGMHLAGMSDWDALLGATLAVAARIGWVSVRYRTLNSFGIVMLTTFGLGLALALIQGEPRYLLLQSSVMTAFVGIMFVVSAARGRRPLTLAATQHWVPSRSAEIAEEYRSDPDVRHGYRVSSTIWGLGLLTDAIARIPLIFLLPISVLVGLSSVMTLAILGVLIVWNILYVRAADRRRGGGEPRAPHRATDYHGCWPP